MSLHRRRDGLEYDAAYADDATVRIVLSIAAVGRCFMTAGPRARLAELGLELPPVSAPRGAYVPAVRTGSYVFVSGQVRW